LRPPVRIRRRRKRRRGSNPPTTRPPASSKSSPTTRTTTGRSIPGPRWTARAPCARASIGTRTASSIAGSTTTQGSCRVGFSRKDDGKPDAWAFSSPDGKIERIEITSTGDEKKIDRWERYDASGLVSSEDDGNADGVVDKWETYQAGALKTAAWDDSGDGKPDRRFTYDGGTLVTIESEPDSAGNFTKRVDVK
jgi:hypothetical protein